MRFLFIHYSWLYARLWVCGSLIFWRGYWCVQLSNLSQIPGNQGRNGCYACETKVAHLGGNSVLMIAQSWDEPQYASLRPLICYCVVASMRNFRVWAFFTTLVIYLILLITCQLSLLFSGIHENFTFLCPVHFEILPHFCKTAWACPPCSSAARSTRNPSAWFW